MTTTKYTFGYFYPTSANSQHFKMPKGGYHVSKFANDGISLIPLKAFKTEKDAMIYCNQLFDYIPSDFYGIDGKQLYKDDSIL